MPRTKKEESKEQEIEVPMKFNAGIKSYEPDLEKLKEKLSEAEFEKKVIELAEKGLTSEKIGETLRREGIHPKNYSKKISKILKEKNLYIVPDIKNLSEKLGKISEHVKKNKQDKRALRENTRIEATLRRAQKYFS